MPLIVKSTHQKYKKQATGGDYNMPSPVLKDRLHIVSASDEISKQISTGFRYTVGNKELEVYVNGLLMRVKENLNGSEYGDYYETSNYFITFDSGVINENDQIRFRMTSNSYDYSNTNTSDIQQLGKDTYGNMFQVSHDGQRHDRTIGTFVDGDTTPNIDDYRTYQTNNSSDTYITNFDGGKIEDIRHIIFKDNHTYLSSGSGLNIFGGTQFKGKTGDMVLAIYDGSEWYVINRANIDSTTSYHLEIVDSSSASTGIINIPFEYSPGSYNLKVYVNGMLNSPIENVSGTNYGDYEETDINTITFESGILNEGDQIRIYK